MTCLADKNKYQYINIIGASTVYMKCCANPTWLWSLTVNKLEINVKNATLNSEKHALHEKLELIQSEVNRQDDSFFFFIMNQTMTKNASGAITIDNLTAMIVQQH